MKKTLGLVSSLTIIAGVCAAVLAYVDSITRDPIAVAQEQKRKDAECAVLCGQKGYAVEGRDSHGYGGDIVLMVGFKEDKKTVISYKVLQAAETPGLGMKLVTPEFAGQFVGKNGSAVKVWKRGQKKGANDIEAITSATITSKAVCRAIADACAKLNK